MSKIRNKLVFSFFVVGSFIIYAILQGFGRLTGQSAITADQAPLVSTAALTPSLSSPVANNSTINSQVIPAPLSSSVKTKVVFRSAAKSLAAQTAVIPTPAAQNNSAAVNVSSVPAVGTTASNNNAPTGKFRDGVYTGVSSDAYYGNVQVQVTIQSGQIAKVQFLDYPHDQRNSLNINSQAIPYLQSEAIAVQSANVDIISGATETSLAFIQSLQSALSQA
jgi:uncharacterized protein with FMN-binding domain